MAFRASEPRAYVIDRAGLDIHLADAAVRAGAEVRTGLKFDGLAASATAGVATVRLRDAQGRVCELAARVVVGADGVTSAVARAFRLRRPVEILPAFEAEFPDYPCDPNDVEVYLGRNIAPGLFGWVIPDRLGGRPDRGRGRGRRHDGADLPRALARPHRADDRPTAEEPDRVHRLGDPGGRYPPNLGARASSWSATRRRRSSR